jgi:hypothetical protein
MGNENFLLASGDIGQQRTYHSNNVSFKMGNYFDFLAV